MLDSIIAILAPHDCLGCNVEGSLLCVDCQDGLIPAKAKCYHCQRPSVASRTCRDCRTSSPLTSVQAATTYEAVAKDVIWKLKFGRSRAAGPVVAHTIARRLGLARVCAALRAAGRPAPIVTHVPTANRRVRQRGYDQASLIARALSRDCGVPYSVLLRRIGHQEQKGADRAQRAAQLTSAFYAIRSGCIRGAHIILVDDVLTTGATLEAAARVLKDAGARRVDAVVFAQV